MNDNIQDIYPLSPMQQGMLFHSLYAPESEVYNEQLSVKINGRLNTEAFRKAWHKVVERHDILRSAFVWEDLDEPLQVVHNTVELPFEYLNWNSKNGEAQEAGLTTLMKMERQKGFDLNEAPLMRFTLIRLADDAHYFLWNHHHLLFDGWALPIILNEVFAYYDALDEGRNVQLPPARPYRDYIAWLQSKDIEDARTFWREKLKGFSAPTPLMVDKERGSQEDGYALEHLVIPSELSNKLNQFTRDHQLTLNTMLQGAWALLLNRYSSEDDIVFGATVSGRPADLPGVESMVGLFINTLPLRVFIDPEKDVLTWLRDIQLSHAEMRQYEFSPLVEIHGQSDVPRNQPLFESILVFENYPVSDSLQEQDSKLTISDVRSFERTNYPITLVASPGRTLQLDIAFEVKRFDQPTIQRMLRHLEQLLTAMVNAPEQALNQLSIITETEREKTTQTWNQTAKPFPDNTTIHKWFEERAENRPSATAIQFEQQTLTYDQLNQKANQMAHHLRKNGIDRETLVGVCLERSPEMIISVLAVLKAGAAYVPMDPEYPEERLHYMIEDSGLTHLITADNTIKRFNTTSVDYFNIDELRIPLQNESDKNPAVSVHPLQLAYVIYTSGSTGNPKGVLLQHRGACNLITAMIDDYGVTPESRVLQFASFSFDASVAEIFLGILSGAALVLAHKETFLSTESLIPFLNQNRITTATLPPSLLAITPPEKVNALNTLISVGDKCSWSLVEQWAPGRQFFNGYGPTEATVGTCWGEVDQSMAADSPSPPIGRPIANVRVYALDRNLQPAPIGIPGEMYIGGVGVARGYLHRPGMTAEKFLPDPFSPQDGARMYKTGDLIRFLPNGLIEFIGRVDFQVKLRGYRIELGEIETAIKSEENVKDAVVLAREDQQGDKTLVAYVVGEIKSDTIRERLREKLPEFMLPSAIVLMDAFPLTPNGKVNRKALPAPQADDIMVEQITPPRTPQEELLAGIFADILRISDVGIHNSFFDLGGHSLMATQLISRIRDTFNVELPLRLLFESSTVAELSSEIQKLQEEAADISVPPLEPIDRTTEGLPLSFAQQRLWFLDKLEPNSASYNIPMAMKINGKLNIEALKQSIRTVIKRHETLRTTFGEERGKPVQHIATDIDFHLDEIDLSPLPEEDRRSEAVKLARKDANEPFDLAAGPLFRVQLLKLSDDEHILLANMHHIISDGWSMGILISEISRLYGEQIGETKADLPELSIQYADFAHWQRRWLQGDVLDKQIDYWKQQLSDLPPLLELPTDRPRPAVQTFNGDTIEFSLPESLSSALILLGREKGATPFMFLMAAFQVLLHRYSRQDKFAVGSPIANRTRSEIEPLIGFFVNTLIMRADFSDNPTFDDYLQRTRETALGAYAHQDLPFEKLVEELQPQRDMSHSPLFQTAFVLQNMPENQTVELPELTMEPLEDESTTAKYDLTLTMTQGKDIFLGSMEYNTDLFDRSTIERMLKHFETLLNGIAENCERPVSELPLLDEQTKTRLLKEWNATETDFPDNVCVHRWFEQNVEKHPDAEAIRFRNDADSEARAFSYAEMNERANRLAHFLIKKGLGPETIAGISMERSLDMVVSMMAILKAGAAYVPIDPTYPDERIRYMVEDSGLIALLTQSALSERLPAGAALKVEVDQLWDKLEEEPTHNPGVAMDPENLAYLIYTSGSTGRPKGTMLRHRGACNLANEQIKAFHVKPGSRILQFSSLSFDAATWEFVMAMMSGAALILTSAETIASGTALVKLMAKENVTTITLPPSVLAVWPQETLPDLKTIITAGEAVSGELVELWGEGRQFVNAYGPTETTVCASMHECSGSYPQPPPIGRPNGNFQLYVLDQHLYPVPVGVPGELCMAGVGLARGYLNRPDLTAEQFMPNPFSHEKGQRLYRSGDLVRYLPDGNIQFLGRIDEQVKIRGFRIELGEIESVLEQQDQIKDVAVIDREDTPGNKELAAYLVLQDTRTVDTNALKNSLRTQLPEYMVPAHFIVLDALPLTPNGKLDRRALPRPERSRDDLQSQYVAARNENEQKLVDIVQTLLQVDKVGIHDNFFELGGHSLLATQFIARVKEQFGIELPLRTLFEQPTVAGIAERLQSAQNSEQPEKAEAQPSIKRVSRTQRRVKRSDMGRGKDS